MRKRPRIGNRGLSLCLSIPRLLRFSYTNWLPRQELSASPSPAGHWWKPTYGKKLCLPYVSFPIVTGFPGLPGSITYCLHNKPLQNFIYWLMCLWVVWVIFLFQAGWDGAGWSWQPHSHSYGLNWAAWAGKVGLGGWGFSLVVPHFPGTQTSLQASQVVLVVKNPPASAGDIRDMGLIPGSGRSLEEGMATHSSILAWRIPWTEEPGGLKSMVSQRIRHDWDDLAQHRPASFIWSLRLQQHERASINIQGLFKLLLALHLLICPMPNNASLRANWESRGGKIDSASDGSSDKVLLQKGLDIGMGL